MPMRTFKLTLRPESAFGTPLAGDTLFGHLCWALRWRQGEAGLTALLKGYTRGQPFVVLSDALPAGLLPRPNLPASRLLRAGDPEFDPKQRKADKQLAWLPAEQAARPMVDWVRVGLDKARSVQTEVRTQNTIHRLTGTTGTGVFAPRQVDTLVHAPGAMLEVFAVLDTDRLPLPSFVQALADIGVNGFGRDASTGLGKFTLVGEAAAHSWPTPPGARHALTLAPCAPLPADLDADDCHYQPVTRFGRHGSLHVLTGRPFKRPLLLLRSAAVLAWRHPSNECPAFHGQGLGGLAQPISAAEPATVHQGYAPVLPLALPELKEAA